MRLTDYATINGAASLAEVPRSTVWDWVQTGRVRTEQLADGTTVVLVRDVRREAKAGRGPGRPPKKS